MLVGRFHESAPLVGIRVYGSGRLSYFYETPSVSGSAGSLGSG
jgi:hypothetical protein